MLGYRGTEQFMKRQVEEQKDNREARQRESKYLTVLNIVKKIQYVDGINWWWHKVISYCVKMASIVWSL